MQLEKHLHCVMKSIGLLLLITMPRATFAGEMKFSDSVTYIDQIDTIVNGDELTEKIEYKTEPMQGEVTAILLDDFLVVKKMPEGNFPVYYLLKPNKIEGTEGKYYRMLGTYVRIYKMKYRRDVASLLLYYRDENSGKTEAYVVNWREGKILYSKEIEQ